MVLKPLTLLKYIKKYQKVYFSGALSINCIEFNSLKNNVRQSLS